MKSKSFTLIELLLVISIIGLLTLVIVSGLRGTTDRARIARTLQYQASLHRSIGDHLVGWWNFNEGTPGTCEGGMDICDIISGNNKHGELFGNTPKEERWVKGVAEGSSALFFNGINDRGVVYDVSALGSSWTIGAWIRIESLPDPSFHIFLSRVTPYLNILPFRLTSSFVERQWQ